jgi:hypothetical protein
MTECLKEKIYIHPWKYARCETRKISKISQMGKCYRFR